jgi:hypothetical protein
VRAGTAPDEPKKCKGNRCRNYLPKDAKLPYCYRCHARNVKRGQLAKEKRMFPGVDIDRIHYKLGAVRKRAA